MSLKPYLLIFLAITGAMSTPEHAQSDDESISTNTPALTGEAAKSITTFKTPASPLVTTNLTSAVTPPADDTVATLVTSDLREFSDQPEAVQRLITQALTLTTLHLSYKYGSDDPKNGGMDCSGTVYYLLNQAGLADVPRDASGMYSWVWKQSRFQAVVSPNADTFELERLKPGDLLFWTGTYNVDRDPPVTHVMIYLGTNRHTGHRVMVGASEGRTFGGKSRYGVSVFDFVMPNAKSKRSSTAEESGLQSRFIGYGSIPGLGKNVQETVPEGHASTSIPKE